MWIHHYLALPDSVEICYGYRYRDVNVNTKLYTSFKQKLYISVPIIPDYLLALEEEQEARDLLGLFWNNTHVNISHFSDLLFNLTFTDLNYTYSKGNFRGEKIVKELEPLVKWTSNWTY